MIRKNEKKYDPHFVLNLTKTARNRKEKKVILDGDKIKADSQRYCVFEKSLRCVSCGIMGAYFVKEKNVPKEKSWHLNLYAVDHNGKEIRMTKDHIVPKSKGGKDFVSNYQTMCIVCNQKKGVNLDKNNFMEELREMLRRSKTSEKFKTEVGKSLDKIDFPISDDLRKTICETISSQKELEIIKKESEESIKKLSKTIKSFTSVIKDCYNSASQLHESAEKLLNKAEDMDRQKKLALIAMAMTKNETPEV